jgi:hypothetical protein
MNAHAVHLLLATVLVSLAAEAAFAHHASSPVYDGSKTISREGTVTEFRLINPHAMMTLETTDDSGKPVTWTIEFVGRLNLVAVGWNEDSLKPGERITVSGNPTHTGSARMFGRQIVKADGTVMTMSSRAEGNEAIDAARRERARTRGTEPEAPQ